MTTPTLIPGPDLTAAQLAQVRTIFTKKASDEWVKAHRFWVLDGTVQARAARHVIEPDAGWFK
jgi:hypothetical protein